MKNTARRKKKMKKKKKKERKIKRFKTIQTEGVIQLFWFLSKGDFWSDKVRTVFILLSVKSRTCTSV